MDSNCIDWLFLSSIQNSPSVIYVSTIKCYTNRIWHASEQAERQSKQGRRARRAARQQSKHSSTKAEKASEHSNTAKTEQRSRGATQAAEARRPGEQKHRPSQYAQGESEQRRRYHNFNRTNPTVLTQRYYSNSTITAV